MRIIFLVLSVFIAFVCFQVLKPAANRVASGIFKHATVLDESYMTLMNTMQAVDSSGNEVAIVEEMEDSRALFKVAPWTEANGNNTHISGREVKVSRTLRSRRINRGNETYFTNDETHKEEISFFEDMVEVDEMIINQALNGQSRRMREIRRHGRDMADGICTVLWYGNSADAENEIHGIATRYNALSLDNVTSAGASTGALASLYLMEFDPDFCSLIYPKGNMTAGVKDEDLGKYRVTDSSGKPYMAYGNKLNINVGLNIAEDARVQRLCNVQVNEASSMGTNDLIDVDAMRNLTLMKKRLPSRGNGSMQYIFVPRELEAQLEIWAEEHSSLCQKKMDLFLGTEVTHIKGIPVLSDDSLLITEDAVS